MKFSPGDPVWAWTCGLPEWNIRPGEHAAVVLSICTGVTGECEHSRPFPGYEIDVLGTPCIAPGKTWCASPEYLRPRRDDYQQHEPLGSMNKIKPLFSKVLSLYAKV
jgi:hypothetical protein